MIIPATELANICLNLKTMTVSVDYRVYSGERYYFYIHDYIGSYDKESFEVWQKNTQYYFEYTFSSKTWYCPQLGLTVKV